MSSTEKGGRKPRGGSITVRLAKEPDIETFVELGRRVHAEGVSNAFPYSPDKVRVLGERAFSEKKGRYGLLVAERDSQAVGMLVGMADSLFFSEAVVATSLVFFVVPEHRGSMAAVKLLHAFKKWAKACGAEAIQIHVTNGVRMQQADRIMKKLGFRQTGGNYMMGC